MDKPSGKKQEELVGLSRKPVVNQLNSIKDSIVKSTPAYDMHGLVDENKLKWFLENFMHLGNSRYPYQRYANPGINNGIFTIEKKDANPITIALLGDWASDTAESRQIAALAQGHDYSIHLGDTYYVGNSREIAENFNSTYGGSWPYGSLGSFAMLGNHEMYSSGKSYFSELLPYMGVYTGNETRQQEASFFSLENEYWRIIGIDTGYYSLMGWLGLKPNPNLVLHDKQLDWLRNTVKPGDDNRGIIFLSHHQPVSAFEQDEYQAVWEQLTGIVGTQRTVLWFWGHEHRLAVYGENTLDGKMPFYGRCIGNSGMPVEIIHEPKSADPGNPVNRNLVLYDKRFRQMIKGDIRLGHNGYVVLKLDRDQLVVNYFDDGFRDTNGNRQPILEECWIIDPASGQLTGKSITDHTAGTKDQLSVYTSSLEVAIGLHDDQ